MLELDRSMFGSIHIKGNETNAVLTYLDFLDFPSTSVMHYSLHLFGITIPQKYTEVFSCDEQKREKVHEI